MGIGILTAGVVPVVRGNQRQVEFPCQLHELPGNLLLPVHAVVLDFDVEVIRAKQIAVAERQFPRLLLVPIPERPRNLARRTTRKANETLVILLQQFVVRPRLVVEAFQLRLRRQLDEILVALVVFRQKREVVLPVVQLRLAVEARAGRHVHLAAQDWLDAPFARLFIELDGAVKYAVIGEADSRKTQFLGAVHQLRHAAHAVEQAVVRMQMQVGKLLHEDTPLLGSAPRQVGNLLGLEYLDGDDNESEKRLLTRVNLRPSDRSIRPAVRVSLGQESVN